MGTLLAPPLAVQPVIPGTLTIRRIPLARGMYGWSKYSRRDSARSFVQAAAALHASSRHCAGSREAAITSRITLYDGQKPHQVGGRTALAVWEKTVGMLA